MKYTFASLGKLESIGLRLGGAGLGNILFPWARSLVYAKNNNMIRITTTWKVLKFGPLFRNEKDKRFYFDLFIDKSGVSGFHKFWLLNFTNDIKYFRGMDGLFSKLINEHDYIKKELFNITNPIYLEAISDYKSDGIGVHIRMGDFIESNNEKQLRNKEWNYRIPIKWYIQMVKKIRSYKNLPVYVFSDAREGELNEILQLPNTFRVGYGSAIADMIALSKSKMLISSSSTFSMWSSFLGQIPTIWFPGQHRQNIIINKDIYEGVIDYNDRLPSKLKDYFNHD